MQVNNTRLAGVDYCFTLVQKVFRARVSSSYSVCLDSSLESIEARKVASGFAGMCLDWPESVSAKLGIHRRNPPPPCLGCSSNINSTK
jgi:hypothetical protein